MIIFPRGEQYTELSGKSSSYFLTLVNKIVDFITPYWQFQCSVTLISVWERTIFPSLDSVNQVGNKERDILDLICVVGSWRQLLLACDGHSWVYPG